MTISFRKDRVAEAGFLHTEILRAAALAVLVGAIVGLLVAVRIASRLRRIASTAALIKSRRSRWNRAGGGFEIEASLSDACRARPAQPA